MGLCCVKTEMKERTQRKVAGVPVLRHKSVNDPVILHQKLTSLGNSKASQGYKVIIISFMCQRKPGCRQVTDICPVIKLLLNHYKILYFSLSLILFNVIVTDLVFNSSRKIPSSPLAHGFE